MGGIPQFYFYFIFPLPLVFTVACDYLDFLLDGTINIYLIAEYHNCIGQINN